MPSSRHRHRTRRRNSAAARARPTCCPPGRVAPADHRAHARKIYPYLLPAPLPCAGRVLPRRWVVEHTLMVGAVAAVE